MNAKLINEKFLKPDTTEEAAKLLDSLDHIQMYVNIFDQLHPYVQSVFIMSALYMTDLQFIRVQSGYRKLIDCGLHSSDEWVRKISSDFQYFPNLKASSDFNDIDISILSLPTISNPFLTPTFPSEPHISHFKINAPPPKPPSEGLNAEKPSESLNSTINKSFQSIYKPKKQPNLFVPKPAEKQTETKKMHQSSISSFFTQPKGTDNLPKPPPKEAPKPVSPFKKDKSNKIIEF